MALTANQGRAVRLLAIGLIIGLAAYWAGTRFGERNPDSVAALHGVLPAPSAAGSLDPTEAENVRIYRHASPAVANIVTRTVEYDFFYNPVPVEGAGSGFLIDTDGHILTNYHVVQGAQTIEVTLGDLSRYKAKLIGEDTRNDIALIQIDTKGRKLTPLPLGDSRNLLVGQRAARHRQSLRIPQHAHHRDRQRAGPHRANQREHFHRRSHPNRRCHQPRKFRRAAAGFARRSDRNQ